MNKRQKKKREKKIAWDAEQTYLRKPKPKVDRYGIDFNHEGYADPTASAAIRRVMKEDLPHGNKKGRS